MSKVAQRAPVARLVAPDQGETLEILGPLIQFLTTPAADDAAPCTMRGTIPPGVTVPLHSHADPETFVVLAGEAEALAEGADGLGWMPLAPGAVFHVPGNAKHAFRNRSREPAVTLIVSTSRIGRFFREVGKQVEAGVKDTAEAAADTPAPPSAETVRHFLETAARYGYWIATPEENARVGLTVPLSPGAGADRSIP